MNDINRRLKQLEKRRSRTSYKHLRGRHDQLQHAWNRGMGAASAAIGAARARAQSLLNNARSGAAEIASGISNRAQALMGQAQGIADAIQPKISDLMGRIDALRGRVSGSTPQMQTQAQGIADAIQPKVGGILGRINSLLGRSRGNQSPSSPNDATPQPQPQQPINETPQQPALPENYDTTRFDTPSAIAPRPIRKELLQPGGEVYDALSQMYDSSDFINYDNITRDATYLKITDNQIALPPNRWQFETMIATKKDLDELAMLVKKHNSDVRRPPLNQNQIWNDMWKLVKMSESIWGSSSVEIDESHPIIKASKKQMIDSGVDEYTIEMNLKSQQNRLNLFNSALGVSSQQTTEMYYEHNQYAKELIANARKVLENASNDEFSESYLSYPERNRIKLLITNLEYAMSNDSERLNDDGSIKDLDFGTMNLAFPAQQVQSYLYDTLEYNGKPSTASWNSLSEQEDAYKLPGQSNPVVMYRSIRDTTAEGYSSTTSSAQEMTATEIYEETLNSEKAHVGYGVDGMGMYFKSAGLKGGATEISDGHALRYGREKYGDHTFAATINENARIYDRPVGVVQNGVVKPDGLNQEIIQEFKSRYGDVFGYLPDIGTIMLMLGYEAYVAREDNELVAEDSLERRPSGYNWVILNRAMLTISQEMITPDTPQDVVDDAYRTGRI